MSKNRKNKLFLIYKLFKYLYNENIARIFLVIGGKGLNLQLKKGGNEMASNEALEGEKSRSSATDFTKIVQSQIFQELLRKKRNFIVPLTIFFFLFYFTLPILTAYTQVLNKDAFGNMSWAWVFAFAEFIMTWTLCTLYTKKAKKFDQIANKIKQDIQA